MPLRSGKLVGESPLSSDHSHADPEYDLTADEHNPRVIVENIVPPNENVIIIATNENNPSAETDNVVDIGTMTDFLSQLLSSLKSDIKSEMSSLKSDVEKSAANLKADLKSDVEKSAANLKADFISHVSSMEQNMSVLGRNVSDLNTQFQESLNKEVDNLKQQLSAEIAQVNINVQENSTKFAEISSNLSVQSEQIHEIRQQCSDVQAMSNENRTKVSDINVRIDSHNTRVESLESHVTELKTMCEQINNRVTHQETYVSRQFRDLTNSVEKLESNNSVREIVSTPVSTEMPGCSTQPQPPPACTIPCDVQTQRESVPSAPNLNPSFLNSNPFALNEITIPRFSNKPHESPLQFLQALDSFMELRNIPSGSKMAVVKMALTGPPALWLNFEIGPDTNYSEFKKSFIQNYWSWERQAELRNTIIHGKYSTKGKKSMADYFIEMSERNRHLHPPFPEVELIRLLSAHFGNDLRSSLIISRPQNLKEALNLIRELQPSSSARNLHYGEYNSYDKWESKQPEASFTNARVKAREYQNYESSFHNNNNNNGYNNNSGPSPPNQNNNRGRNQNWSSNRNSNQNPQNFDRKPYRQNYNNNQNQPREARINLLDFNSGDRPRRPFNNNRIPWYRRRQYNGRYFQSRRYYDRFRPYNNNNRYSNNQFNCRQDSDREPNTARPNPHDDNSYDRVISRIDEQNQQRNSERDGPQGGVEAVN